MESNKILNVLKIFFFFFFFLDENISFCFFMVKFNDTSALQALCDLNTSTGHIIFLCLIFSKLVSFGLGVFSVRPLSQLEDHRHSFSSSENKFKGFAFLKGS